MFDPLIKAIQGSGHYIPGIDPGLDTVDNIAVTGANVIRRQKEALYHLREIETMEEMLEQASHDREALLKGKLAECEGAKAIITAGVGFPLF